jgi:Tol biopolymer transport system component/DNA-binding winged helix-turn-helix (wHTH) protein
MSQPTRSAQVIRFDNFEVDLRVGELRKHRRRIRLQEQPFQVLALLLEHPGEIITREEIREKLWPADTFVDFDHGLNSAVGRLRDALSDSAGNPKFIETVPRKGYRFIGEPEILATETEKPIKHKYFRIWAAIGVAMLALLLVVAVRRFLRARAEVSIPPIEVAPLTGLPGKEARAAFSPDGRQVAFEVVDGRDNSGIVTALVGGEKPLRLTTDPGDCCSSWSPDGSQIAFLRLTGRDLAIYTIPALGGTEHKIYTGRRPLYPSLSWSPDGKLLAFPANAPDGARSWIAVLSLSDMNTRAITTPPDDARDNQAGFSPDGSKVAFERGTIAGVVNDLFVTSAQGGEARRLTFDRCQIEGLSWTADGKEIVYSSMRGGQKGLWRIPAEGGTPRPVAGTGFPAYGPAIARRGNLLAYDQASSRDNIWRVNLKDEKHAEGSPAIVISAKGSKLRPQFSPDGKQITFESDRLGSTEIWACDTDSANCAQLTSLHGTVGTSRWSPNGRAIAFEFHPGERAEIYVQEFPGGTPRLMPTIPEADNLVPSWSRDGQWIYFTSKRGGSPFQLWKIAAKGGAPVQITRHGGLAAVESADGRFLYYSKYEADGVWRASMDGANETRVLDEPEGALWFDWTLSSKGIYYLSHATNDRLALKFFDFASNRSSIVLNLDRPIGWGLALSPNEKSLIYVELELEESSIMLVRNFR